LQQEADSFPKNLLRHYYDLYCLLDSPEVQSYIGTPQYHVRKQERFRQADNLHIASNELADAVNHDNSHATRD